MVIGGFFIELKNISKKYKTTNKKDFLAISSVSLSLNKTGFMAIIGKSGSGKTTLANIIAFYDFDFDGSIYVSGKKVSSLSKNEKHSFRDENIGMVFQNYHLILEEDVVYNIALPLLISGVKKSTAIEKSITILEKISFPKKLYYEKVKNLSGGEQQRVAILRALIKNPSIIIADEPTGALDKDNALIVMELLKTISKDKLVIVISHDQNLVKQYCNRLIKLKDGKVVKDELKSSSSTSLKFANPSLKKKKSELWTWHFSKTLFKTSKRQNIMFSIIFMICFTLTNLLLALFGNSNVLKIEESRKVLDYSAFKISRKIDVPIEGANFSLMRTLRLEKEELKQYEDNNPKIVFKPSLDSLFLNDNFLYLNSEIIDINASFAPIYSFKKEYINNDLFIYKAKEKFPSSLIINDILYKKLLDSLGKNVLDAEFEVKFSRNIILTDTVAPLEETVDFFVFSRKYKIFGVVEEFSFLSEPKIYYSYEKMEDELKDYPLVNISTKKDRAVNVLEYMEECSSSDELSGYAHYGFWQDLLAIEEYEKSIYFLKADKNIEVDSLAFKRKEAFINILDTSLQAGVFLFAFIVIGSLVIIGVITFSSYVLNQKTIAIFLSLGASKYHVFKIFNSINVLLMLVSYFGALVLNSPFLFLINSLIEKITGIKQLASKDISLFYHGKNYEFLLILAVAFLSLLLVGSIPLIMKKISITKELKTDD